MYFFEKRINIKLCIESQGDLMRNIFEPAYSLFLKSYRNLADLLYVPTQTGSHDLGEQYLGDLASAYVEHKNFPEAAQTPFKGFLFSKRCD